MLGIDEDVRRKGRGRLYRALASKAKTYFIPIILLWQLLDIII